MARLMFNRQLWSVSDVKANRHHGEHEELSNCKSYGCTPVVSFSDTERLNFLLQFLHIDDVGDETVCLAVRVDREEMEEKIGFGSHDEQGRAEVTVLGWEDDLRSVIDRAIAEHKKSV